MTRLRKEIRKEMDELYMQEQAEYEIIAVFKTVAYSSEGYRYYDFVNAEYEKLAATYGMTVQAYEAMQYEIGNKLVAAGVLPFN